MSLGVFNNSNNKCSDIIHHLIWWLKFSAAPLQVPLFTWVGIWVDIFFSACRMTKRSMYSLLGQGDSSVRVCVCVCARWLLVSTMSVRSALHSTSHLYSISSSNVIYSSWVLGSQVCYRPPVFFLSTAALQAGRLADQRHKSHICFCLSAAFLFFFSTLAL